jgi:autotransporter passenger strand-loop-strand repeat protein
MTTVSSGQTLNVISPQTSTGVIVLAGGTLNVFSGGTISGTVDSGGRDNVSAGGSAFGTTVSSGGAEYDYGVTISTRVGNGAAEYVGGITGFASASIVDSGGFMEVDGTASGTTVYGGVEEVIEGAKAYGTTLKGGSQDVDPNGKAYGTTVSSGGVQNVYGTASGTTVSNGGEQDAFGVADDTTVMSGGRLIVYNAAGGTTVSSGGLEYVSANADTGEGIETTVIGGTVELGPAGALPENAVFGSVAFAGAGGALLIDLNASMSGTISGFRASDRIDFTAWYDSAGSATLGAGNVLTVSAFGTGYDLNFDPSQAFIGYRFGLSPDGSGGTDVTLSAQPLTSAVTIFAGQTAYDVPVASGGSLTVLSGGTLSGATVSSGAVVSVVSGGNVFDPTISGGAVVYVSKGGFAERALVKDGAYLYTPTR